MEVEPQLRNAKLVCGSFIETSLFDIPFNCTSPNKIYLRVDTETEREQIASRIRSLIQTRCDYIKTVFLNDGNLRIYNCNSFSFI